MAITVSLLRTVVVYLMTIVVAGQDTKLSKESVGSMDTKLSKESDGSMDDFFTPLTAYVNRLAKSLSEIQSEVNNLEESMSTMSFTVTGMRILLKDTVKDVTNLKKDVESLKIAEAKINNQIALVDDVHVVSGEQTAGRERCVKVCAGTTGRTTTNWRYYSSKGIYTDVDMKKCGFKTVPTVTTSIEGTSNHWTSRGTASVYSTTSTKFRLYLEHNNLRNGGKNYARSRKWNVEWIAVGYTC